MATWHSNDSDGSEDGVASNESSNSRHQCADRSDPTSGEGQHSSSDRLQVEDTESRRRTVPSSPPLPKSTAKLEAAISESAEDDPEMTTTTTTTMMPKSLEKPGDDDIKSSSTASSLDLSESKDDDDHGTSEVKRLVERVTHLETEKAALSDELERMRRAAAADDDNRTDDKKELETVQRRLRLLEDQVTSLDAERESLKASLEELDEQHEMAIGQLLASRDQWQRRCDQMLQDEEQMLDTLVETMRRRDAAAAAAASSSSSVVDVRLSEEKLSVLADLLPLPPSSAHRQRIRELEEALVDRDRQVGALDDILRVYKENLEPNDDGRVREWQRRLEEMKTERAEMMSLLDDKTRENANLKVEVHRLLDVVSSVRSSSTSKTEVQKSRAATAEADSESEDMTKEALKNMARLVRDREVEIHALEQKNATLLRVINESSSMTGNGSGESQQKDTATTEVVQVQEEVERLRQEREQLVEALNRKHAESVAYHEEIRRLGTVLEQVRTENGRLTDSKTEADKELQRTRTESASLSEQLASLHGHNGQLRSQMEQLRTRASTLGEANSMLSVTLQEREFELKALREKEDTLSRLVKSRDEADDDKTDIGRLLSESERMRETAQGFQAERDQAILALRHERQETDEVRRQMEGVRDRERRLVAELDRLRAHLLHVEESYTEEALGAEDREKELRLRLAQAEQRGASATTATSTTHHQTESLQEQLRAVVEQRNEVLVSLSTVEDQLEQKTTALHTLRVVLERLQQERHQDLAALQARHEAQMVIEKTKNDDLQRHIRGLVERQKETSEALDAASRLTEQLDHKEDSIRRLRDEVASRNAEIEKTKQEISRIHSNSEVTVDRSIVKSLVVGLLTVPVGQRKEVLRVIATILDFNSEEREKTGLDEETTTTRSGWMSGWLSPSKPQGRAKTTTDQSLTEAFVRFLERESQPANSAAAAAAERPKPAGSSSWSSSNTVATTRQKQMAIAPRINPFNYPMTLDRPPPLMTGTMSPLLLKPMSTVMPTFATTTTPDSSVTVKPTTAVADNASFLREALQRNQ